MISALLATALASNCRAIVIENLDFAEAWELGREHSGCRPSRGKRGKNFRRLVAGIPTSKFCQRLVQMATNIGVVVIAVDPAYTSKWGAELWLGSLKEISPDASGHHAAARGIGRRGRIREHDNRRGLTRLQRSMEERGLPARSCGPRVPGNQRSCPSSERGTPGSRGQRAAAPAAQDPNG